LEHSEQSILIVDSGDLLFKKPQITEDLKEDAVARADLILEASARMGCDALNIGPYDLAMGTDFLLERQKRVPFPFLSANLVDAETGKPVFKPYCISTKNGIRIGILGLITEQANQDLLVSHIKITDPVEAATKAVAELQKNRCDLIIALTQLVRQENIELAEKVSGIHFIMAGNKLGPPFGGIAWQPVRIKGTLVFQAYNLGRYLGRLDLVIIDSAYKFVSYLQKPGIFTEIKRLRERIQGLREELSPCPSDGQEMKQAVEDLDRVKEHLENAQGCSYYSSIRIILDKKIQGGQDIEEMVKQYKGGAEDDKMNNDDDDDGDDDDGDDDDDDDGDDDDHDVR
jgi:2',3'-cyclic-nucleotide 2'-phosphodiesterase (5'-nucleotidase family)